MKCILVLVAVITGFSMVDVCLAHNASHIHRTFTDVKSLEFLRVANHTIDAILRSCIFTWMYDDKHIIPKFEFPSDAEEHYAELKQHTEAFRHNTIHSYAGYSGPWIENIWINQYFNMPLAHFRGVFPIFMQWIDSEIVKEMKQMIEALQKVIRPNVLYLAISQGDAGLHEAAAHFPNVLVMSAGGFGHIALPLIKGELSLAPIPDKFERDFAFYGTDRPERHDLLMSVSSAAKAENMSLKIGYGKDWIQGMAQTRFNLAPRGYGRSSFRFAEIIHLGRIPIYLYNDYKWLPYLGTNISVDSFGFAAKVSEVPELVAKIKQMTESEFQQRLAKVQEVRFHYTYHGVMKQIEHFLRDPLGAHGGDLRCTQHPRTFFCCG